MDGYGGGLTDLEREAGVASLLRGPRTPTARQKRVAARQREARKEAAKAIAALENVRHIKYRLIHMVMQDELDYAISRYLAYEKVPEIYRAVSRSGQCVEILVRGLFYKILKISSDAALETDIAKLSKLVRGNPECITAYRRVSAVQKFIHERVDYYFGVGAHSRLPKEHMRNTLSVCRLHLMINDIESKGDSYAIYLDEVSWLAARYEEDRMHVGSLDLSNGSIPHWRVRHLKPLMNFAQSEARNQIALLRGLDEHLPLEEFKRMALEAFEPNTEPYAHNLWED